MEHWKMVRYKNLLVEDIICTQYASLQLGIFFYMYAVRRLSISKKSTCHVLRNLLVSFAS